MQAYTELIPPTAVTHSVSLPFINSKSPNLVVAKGSLLQIFSLKSVASESVATKQDVDATRPSTIGNRRGQDEGAIEESYLDGSIIPQRLERTFTTKLNLEAEYPVSGTITSLARIKISTVTNGTEALLVGVKDAKISLLSWDPERHNSFTVSIHYYEGESVQRCPWAPDLALSSTKLTVDPGNRCVALKFGTRNLAILPFYQAGFEDLAMDDFEAELDGENTEKLDSKMENGADTHENGIAKTPYNSSFVLSLTLIDPKLVYPIDMAFLYEYRDPTFGILSSTVNPSSALLQERRDVLTYSVFLLDIEQKASTPLLSVSGLPSDLHRVIPLPTPVGGSLLVGANELVHVDQSGKTSAVAVNEFARRVSNLGMADQSNLQMRLEFCEIEQLGVQNGDALLILQTGELAILSFKLDGRTVSGLSIRKVDERHGGTVLKGAASCCTNLGRGRIFTGGDETDASLLGWTRRSTRQLQRRGLNGAGGGDEDDTILDFEDVKDYDDDLYANDRQDMDDDGDLGAPPSQDGDYVFRVHHTLKNLSPLLDMTISTHESKTSASDQTGPNQIVVSARSGESGSIEMLRQVLEPDVVLTESSPILKGIWTIKSKRPAARGMPQLNAADGDTHSADSLYDRFLFTSEISTDHKEGTSIAKITPTGFKKLDLSKFEGDTGPTIDLGVISKGTRIVHVVPHQLQTFDGDLGLVGILPMADELTGAEPKVLSASFADPYVLVVRDDSSILVAQCDAHGEIEELERGDRLLSTQWISGALYVDSQFSFLPKSNGKKETTTTPPILMFLLTSTGGLHIYQLPNLDQPIYIAEGFSFLHPVIQADETYRRSAIREILTEILVADIGDDTSTKCYLITRNANECLTVYEPFHSPSDAVNSTIKETLRFSKLSHPSFAAASFDVDVDMQEQEEVKRSHCMRRFSDIGNYSVVFIPGKPGRFLMKRSTSQLSCLQVPNITTSCLSSYHTAQHEHAWIQVDGKQNLAVCKFPTGFDFNEIGWASRRIAIGEEVQALGYYSPSNAYVLATNRKEQFELPKDDDHHKAWASETTEFKPLVDRSSLKVLNPTSWTIVDTYEFEATELVHTIQILDLEVSEKTRKHEKIILVGTSITQGLDLPTKGGIYAFKVISVVPWPDQPETGIKLKLLGKESVKGAVTSISAIGTEGFFFAANGQKCMVRGLKEDGSMLPVAFMDAQTYVSVAKGLPNTRICMVGDAARGLWLTGYQEDPYKLTIFGKTSPDLEIVAAEFLPEGDALYVAVADADMDLHIFQYDPENPKSMSGQRLLPRSTFHLGQYVTKMQMIPSILPFPQHSRLPSNQPPNSPQQILITTRSGAIGVLQPLPPTIYSTLSALATHLNTLLDHAGGLNPRGYRQAIADGMGGRVVLDGALLRRFWELGCGKRADLLGRVGAEGMEVREALKWLGGAGLGF